MSNFRRYSPDVESVRRFQHLTNTFGWMGTLGIDRAIIMMTMQQSLTMKIVTFLAGKQAHHLRRYREKSRASDTRKETWEQGARKESESSSFPPPLTTSPLTNTFACHSIWEVAPSPEHFLIVVRVHSSVSQFMLGIGGKNRAFFIPSNVH